METFCRYFPVSLTWSRVALAPLLVILVYQGAPGWSLGAIVLLAFCTDLFDGILARRWGVATAWMRQFDGIADLAFYLAVVVALVIRRWDVVEEYGLGFAGLLAAEVGCHVVSLIRFGKTTATHTYVNKAWAVALAIAVPWLFLGREAEVVVPVILAMGAVGYAEVLAMLLIAREPPIDVATLWRLVRRQQREGTAA